MFVATKRCVVQTDNAHYKFMPGDDIGMLPRNLIDQMVDSGQAYTVEVITLVNEEPSPGEIGSGDITPEPVEIGAGKPKRRRN